MNTEYKEKTDRINAWRRFGELAIKSIWLIIVVIILGAVGKLFLIDGTTTGSQERPPPVAKPIIQPRVWNEVDQAIVEALKQSRISSEQLASKMLDEWIAKLMHRVDSNFLKWYFSYWNQQVIGIRALWYGAVHWVDSDRPSASEKVTETVQEQFAHRVLLPQVAQLELERITREVVNHYAVELKSALDAIPEKYQIPVGAWERHLDGIAVMTSGTEGNREVDLTLKAIATSSVAGTVVLAKAMGPAMKSVGTKVSAKVAGKAAAKMAAKTGAKVSAKAGGKLLGPIVGVGIIIWDLWDHNATKKENLPILREGIYHYLQEIKDVLLRDSESGVMTVLYGIESQALENLQPQQ